MAFLVSWRGDGANRENPEWHDPAVCLPAAGARLDAVLGEFVVPVGDVPVPFVGYRFVAAGRPCDVFFCYWDAELGQGSEAMGGPAADVRARRLRRVREGRRGSDVAHLTLVLEDATDAAAIDWLRMWAPQLLKARRAARDLPD
jgi:hypothetical protein